MRAGLQVALRAHDQVQAAMTSEQVEHVIEEADPGDALSAAAAVERQLDVDLGLCGTPVDLSCSRHRWHCRECAPPSSERAARRRCAFATMPAMTRTDRKSTRLN